MRKTTIITGAMGSGKTEVVLQIAGNCSKEVGTTLIDLDFVNPFYRSVDKGEELKELGITLLGPEHISIDTPLIMPGTAEAMVAPTGQTIVDLGGDESGAKIIAQFAPSINEYDFFAVVNFSRVTTENAEDTIRMLYFIEDASRLKLTGIISNTHMKEYTTAKIILDGFSRASLLSEELNLPLIYVVTTAEFEEEIREKAGDKTFVMERRLKNIWE